MKSQDFTYAVSRIRMKETKLLTKKDMERLVSQKDYQSTLRLLSEFSFGDGEGDILKVEQEKLWSLMAELVDDISVFDVFRLQNDFHNLKVSVKSVYSDVSPDSMFLSGGTVEGERVFNSIKNRDFKALGEVFDDVSEAALDTILKTGDGQLCDALIDKACLKVISQLGENPNEPVINDYAELFVASANIKIAVRGSKLNKSLEFFTKSLSPCNTIDTELLAKKAVKGFDEICSYLSQTKYKDAVKYIRKSMSSFEKWCDDLLINGLKNQKYEPFTVGPLVAYILAKQNEIKAVRLILIGKRSGLEDTKISERIRELYV